MSSDLASGRPLNFHSNTGSGNYVAGDNHGVVIQHAIDKPTREFIKRIAEASKPLADQLEEALRDGIIPEDVVNVIKIASRNLNEDSAAMFAYAARNLTEDV